MMPRLTLPENRDGSAAFSQAIVADLQPLVDMYQDRHAALIEHLAAQVTWLPRGEQTQAQKVLDHWRGLVPPTDVNTALPWWDFRLGAERDAIPPSPDLLPRAISEAISDLSQAWGLTSSHGLSGHFNVVLILGGLVPADFARPEFLNGLLASGRVQPERIVGLAGNRRLSAWESNHPGAEGCTTEAAALAAGFARAGIRDFTIEVSPDVDGRRATTSSSVDWWLTQNPALRTSGRIASVTSSIYRVRNHIDVLTLTAGCHVETASVSARSGVWRPQFYLQEMKAAVDRLTMLRRWAGLD